MAGVTFGVIGAFYGLLLAFVIVAAWQRFDRAEAEAQGEGVALLSLLQAVEGLLPTECDGNARGDPNLLAHKVIDEDWPDMANYRLAKVEDSAVPRRSGRSCHMTGPKMILASKYWWTTVLTN